VLRSNGHVLKAYGAPRQFEAAVAGLLAAAAGPLPTGAPAGADPELRLVAQRAVAGRRPDGAQEVAAVAGALAAELAAARLEGLPVAPPARHLRGAARKGALIADVLPELRPRVEALLDRLGRERPAGLPAVPAHGDFHVDQLLVADRVAVVDFDQMCLAAPALDVATYAADVVRGRDGDLAEVGSVLEAFLTGYGPAPDALAWHLRVAILGRAAHPFHRQLPGWPDRVEAMLHAAERARA
jgi:Ser/Thr protein kinase RdoA (MazF antagonist)